MMGKCFFEKGGILFDYFEWYSFEFYLGGF